MKYSHFTVFFNNILIFFGLNNKSPSEYLSTRTSGKTSLYEREIFVRSLSITSIAAFQEIPYASYNEICHLQNRIINGYRKGQIRNSRKISERTAKISLPPSSHIKSTLIYFTIDIPSFTLPIYNKKINRFALSRETIPLKQGCKSPFVELILWL